MTAMTTPDIAAIAAGLSAGAVRVLTSPRFVEAGWEPRDPYTPTMNAMVEEGLFVRKDGRCGFERFKDVFVVPTALAIAVRAHLAALSKE